jgi:uncharacterized protein (DUF305 family)
MVLVVAGVTATAIVIAVADRDDGDVHTRPGAVASAADGEPGSWEGSWGSMMGGRAGSATEPDYLAEMVAHHEEAVVAARELSRSSRPKMRAFGASIVASQSAQITQMRAWLENWYPDLSPTVDHQPMMRDLSGLSGGRLDRLFLQDMIGHHMVAVAMSHHLLLRGVEHEQVASLARSIRDEQHAEIARMQRWLALWFDTDWRPAMGLGMAAGGHGGAGPGSGSGPGQMWES